MTIQPGANLYTQGQGSRPEGVEVPVFSTIAPTSTNIHYPEGKRWIDTTTNAEYVLTSFTTSNGVVSANWTLLGTAAGNLNTLTGDSGGAISPSAGNINVVGTASQISTAGAGSTITWSLSSTLIAPGSLEVTGLLTGDAGATLKTAGTAMNIATDTDTAAVNIATAGARTTTIGDTTTTSGTVMKVGTGNFSLDGVGASTYTFGPSTTSGTMNIGGTGANTGTMTIAGGTGAQTINIANSTGDKTVAIATGAGANAITLGSTNTTSATTINAGTGGLALTAAGAVSMEPATSSTASPTASVTMNNRVGCATFTGFTTASGSSQVFTITNSTVLTTSAVFVTVTNLDASGNHAEMTLISCRVAANTLTIDTKNNGAGALGAGDNVLINFWVLS